jgi:hypothetical protein
MNGHGLAPSDRVHSLVRLCFDADSVSIDPKGICNTRNHPADMRRKARALKNDRRIDRGRRKAGGSEMCDSGPNQPNGVRTEEPRVARWEVRADVTEAACTQQGVDDCMREGIAVGIPDAPNIVRHDHAAKHQRISSLKSVNVIANPHPE